MGHALAANAQYLGGQSKTISNFWERMGDRFLDTTAAPGVRENSKKLDSLRSILLRDNVVTFLDLQGELDTLHRFKKEMDRSWGAAVDSLLTDYLFTTESIVGDSGLHRRSPTISEHFAYNSRIVHDAYKTGNPSLLAYSLDYAKSDNVDTWLEELGNVKYLGSKNSV